MLACACSPKAQQTVPTSPTPKQSSTPASDLKSPALQGIAIRWVAPGAFGKLPKLELVNGSHRSIFVQAQGGALASVEPFFDEHSGSSWVGICGTGIGPKEVAPGKALYLTQVAAMWDRAPLARGTYRISVDYGVHPLRDDTHSVSIEVKVDGPEPKWAAVVVLTR